MPTTILRKRRRAPRLLALAAALCALGAAWCAPAASADHHLMKITEVHQGTGGTGTGDYVELQMYASGQQFVGGHYLVTYDGGSGPISTFLFPSDVANGQSQRTILIANDASVTGADFDASGAGGLNVVQNGSVCFLTNLLGTAVDCVSIGSATNTGSLPSPTGTPVSLPGGMLGDGQSISRSITAGCATLLEASDDTDNSNADFAIAAPSPRPNSVVPTEQPCEPTPQPPTTKKKMKKCKKGFKLKKIKPKKKGKKPKKKCVRIKKKK